MAPSYKNAVDFRQLPSEIQDRLIAWQGEGEDHFVFLKSVSLLWLAPLVAAVAWLIYVYTATQQPLWENWMPYMVGGVSAIILPIAFYSLTSLVKPRLAKLKTGYIVTPDEFIKTSGNCLRIYGLKDIEALRFKEGLQEIEVWIGGREETINVTDPEKAMKLDRLFDQLKDGAGTGITAYSDGRKYAFNQTKSTVGFAAGVLAAIALGLLVGRGSAAVNRGFDDEQTWKRAEQLNSIEEFENYKARHPNGVHKNDAEQKIAEGIAKIKDAYVVRASKEASPDAVKAMSALLANASASPDRTVFVKVSEDRQLDDSVVQDLSKAAGTPVYDYETSVPRSAEEFRKNKVFSDIQVMMNTSLGRGVVNLQLTDDPPADRPAIEALLQIKSEKTIYRIANYDGGRMHTDLYAGANFTFQINIEPGGSDGPYYMEYSGQPPQLSPTVYDRRDKENFTFDKIYFSAVTEGFDQTMLRTFGFVGTTTATQ